MWLTFWVLCAMGSIGLPKIGKDSNHHVRDVGPWSGALAQLPVAVHARQRGCKKCIDRLREADLMPSWGAALSRLCNSFDIQR